MVHIKTDHIDNMGKLLSPKKPIAANVEKRTPVTSEDVSVELRHLAGLVVAENSSADETRVLEMKNKIETNNYQVDSNALATKLFDQVFSKTIG